MVSIALIDSAIQEGALHWAQSRQCSQRQPGSLKMGFHSLPSLLQLHMHVISQVLHRYSCLAMEE